MAKKPKSFTCSIDAVPNDVYAGMEELKDELQNWYDNLPESFQQGDKGSALQEAIDTIDGVSEINVPDCLEGAPNLPEVTYYVYGTSRAKRRDQYTSMLSGAADATREYVEFLRELEYDDDGKPKDTTEGLPEDELTRDNWIGELETFADECESAQSDYDGVEFPGMYG